MTFAAQIDVRALTREVQAELASGTFGASSSHGALRTLRDLGLHTADVEAECHRLQELLKQKHRIYGGFGIVKNNGSLPVPFDTDGLGEIPKSWQVKPASKEELLDGMARALERFLDVRASHGGKGVTPLRISPNRSMLQFIVNTLQHHGRVHYAPSFFITARHVFGSPTSPVYGVLDPGSYLFGIDYPGKQFEWDSGTYDVPPAQQADLQI